MYSSNFAKVTALLRDKIWAKKGKNANICNISNIISFEKFYSPSNSSTFKI